MSSVDESVRAALEGILLPKLDKNLVEAGMVDNVSVEGERAQVLLHFKPAYASKSQLKQWVREAVSGVEGISEVEVEFTQSKQAAQGQAQPHEQQPQGQRRTVPPGERTSRTIELPGVKHTVVVFSGKGGVGKSTVSLNLAVALAEAGASVGLFDADVHGPNLHSLLGVRGQPMLEGSKIAPVETYGLKMISLGLLVDPHEALIWRGPMITKAINELLSGTNWGELDYMVVDLPPGTGDASLGLAQDLELAGSIAVTTPQELALADVRRGMVAFERLEVPLWGVIENMSGYVCPHCGKASDIFGSGGGEREAEERGVPFLGRIPLDPAIREAEDECRPVVVHAPESPAAQAFQNIARNVLQQQQESGPRTYVQSPTTGRHEPSDTGDA